MKKNLLLVAAMCATMCASAQGTWKAGDFMNGMAADAMALSANQEITSVPGITFIAGAATDDAQGWLAKPSSTGAEFPFNGITYSEGYVQGTVNGATYKGEDGVTILPTLNKAATMDAVRAEFLPAVDGTLDVAFKMGYNKQFWVIETTQEYMDGDDFTGAFTAADGYNSCQYWGGYFYSTGDNAGQYYTPAVAGTPDETAQGELPFTGVTLNVTAGKKYIVMVTGSKLMLCGFNFVPSTAAISSVEAAEVASEKYYTVSGMEVAVPVKGINIVKQTMVDGTVKTVKVIK